jgi:solute carrier family 25 carnitine/acylcarnitine transporter 20/29
MIASGFFGGMLSGFACAPMELVMIQQQRFGKSLFDTASMIIKDHGVLGGGLMRGLITASGREGLFTAGYLGASPVIGRYLVEEKGMGKYPAKMVGAVGAGLVAATLSHPMDTIKTCMQGDMQKATYGSLTSTARTIYSESGAGAFFRGWSWRAGRMISSLFILDQCKSQLTPILFPQYFD